MTDYFRKTQLCQLELLKKFLEICEKEGFSYYLLGGSALGAVRHKGFIPWDDDIDVGMLRDDYEKFLNVADKYLEKGQRTRHFTRDASYPDYTAKLEDTNVCYTIQKATGQIMQNIWVDIFPIDGSPKSNFQKKIHNAKIKKLRKELSLCHPDNIQFNSHRSLFERIIIKTSQKMHLGKLIDSGRLIKKIDRELKKYQVQDDEYISNYMGAYYEKEMMPMRLLGKGKEAVFEGINVIIPEITDEYLKHLYGDYMKLPPEDEQIPKHSVIDIHFLGER